MPHTRSAAKYLRKTEKRRLRNRAVKKAIKTQIKKFMDVAKAGNVEELQKELVVTAKKLDKAAAKRAVHPNMAARKKGQLAKLVNAKANKPAPAPKA
jgi:small subunit ribosomal protein S20